MSELKKLLEGINVDWLALSEVANFRRGSFPQPYGNSEWYDGIGAMPFVQVNDVNKNMQLVSDTKNKISKLAQPKSVFVPKNTVIVTLQGSIGRVAITQYDAYVDRTLAIFENYKIEICSKYFAYQLSEKFNIEKETARGSTIKTITKEEFSKFKIPIPCPDNPEKSLKIQEEIVRFLDRLSEETNQLTAALQKELQLHQKRYDFYREELFKFEGKEVEWKSLGEVSKLITKGTTPKKYSECGISFIKTEAFSGSNIILKKLSFIDEETHEKELKRSMLEENDILITIAGATIGKCAIVPKEVLPANTNQALAIIRLMDVVDVKFIFHLLKSGLMKKYIELNSKGSAQPNLNLKQLNDFVIPFTSLVEQSRIVKILDDLDVETKAITKAIQKEIALRSKQYEYYRDSLLSFQSLETVAEAVQ